MIAQKGGAETLSGTFMAFASLAYQKCIKDKESGKVLIDEGNSYSAYAIEVYIMTVTALEAFINEVISSLHGKQVERVPVEIFEDMDLKNKYYYFPLLYWGKTFNKNESLYADFSCLIKVRNCFVHYKMDPEEERRYYKHLNNKKLLLTSVSSFTGKVSNAKAALWAYNTTCDMAHKLIEFGDDRTKIHWGSMLSNFTKISDSVDVIRNTETGKTVHGIHIIG